MVTQLILVRLRRHFHYIKLSNQANGTDNVNFVLAGSLVTSGAITVKQPSTTAGTIILSNNNITLGGNLTLTSSSNNINLAALGSSGINGNYNVGLTAVKIFPY